MYGDGNALGSVWFVALFEFWQHENQQKKKTQWRSAVQCALGHEHFSNSCLESFFHDVAHSMLKYQLKLAEFTWTRILFSLFYCHSLFLSLSLSLLFSRFVVLLKLRTSGNCLAHHRWSAGDMRSIHSLSLCSHKTRRYTSNERNEINTRVAKQNKIKKWSIKLKT